MEKTSNPVSAFLKKHWMDILVILIVVFLLFLLGRSIFIRFNFAKKWDKFYNHFFTNEGYKRLLTGMQNTGLIAVIGFFIGLTIGTLIATIKEIPPYHKLVRYAQKVCNVYVAFFRGTPIVVQLLVGYYILLPIMGLSIPALGSCILIFGLNSGAYISEIMRGGIQSVDPGQLEAARAVGLSFPVAMVKVVIPQAVKNILPTLGNEIIALVKETAIVGYVGAVDITKAFQDLAANSYEYMIPYIVMALLYIVIVAAIAGLIRLMEKAMKKSEAGKGVKSHG